MNNDKFKSVINQSIIDRIVRDSEKLKLEAKAAYYDEVDRYWGKDHRPSSVADFTAYPEYLDDDELDEFINGNLEFLDDDCEFCLPELKELDETALEGYNEDNGSTVDRDDDDNDD